jgi:ABC-type antimicrobial peptide transport system permease subunit
VHPWREIVGVVPERGMAFVVERDRVAGLYMPAPPRAGWPVNLLVHTRGDPLALLPTARDIASTADATLRIVDPQRLDEVATPILWVLGVWLRSVLVLSAITMLLSLAGIYAVLSFTVARRTREIGVRVALGASRARVAAAVFRRPLTQVALGVVAGGLLILGASQLLAQGDGGFSGDLSPGQFALLLAHVTLMFGVCLLACVVPTRRALRIEPTEALRGDA